MDTKMDRKKFPEWMTLDIMFVVGMMVYLLAQFILTGNITDTIFIVMLSFATFFLNYRQLDLYNSLMKREGKDFFHEIYSQEEHKKQIRNIFLSPVDTYISLGYAFIFSVVILSFNVWDNNPVLNLSFSFFLFMANIPTGYAILRILKYFYYNVLWIKQLNFGMGLTNHFSERYIKKVCYKVLFTATTYSAVSLSSIFFTQIELNIIVILYTIFAVILVMTSLSLTNVFLRREREGNRWKVLDEIDVMISSLVESVMSDKNRNHETMEKLRDLVEVKDYITKQTQNRFSVSNFISSIGLLFITIIPVILQWLLELLTG